MSRDALLDTLYAAPLDASVWPRALAQLCDLFEAQGANIEIHDASRGPTFLQTHNLHGVHEYLAHYRSVCPRFGLHDYGTVGQITHDAMLGSESDLDRFEFYADFLERYDLRYFASALIEKTPRTMGFAAIQRSKSSGILTRTELRRFAGLLPHIQRAVRLSQELQRRDDQVRDFREIISRSSTGVLLLDALGRVVFANLLARELIESSPVLTTEQGTLRARRSHDNDRLVAYLRAARTDPPDDRPLHLGRTPSEAITLTATPLARRETQEEFIQPIEEANLMVTLRSLSAHGSVRPGDLVGFCRITPAEATVAAAFANGVALREFADQRGLSIHTVRMHLQRVKEKLRCRTQAELVAALLHISDE